MDFFQKVKDYAKMTNTTIEDFIFGVFEGGKDRDSFNGWKRRGVLPRADETLKIAKAMAITVEELIEGEAGADYVRQWARNEGKIYKPPERISDIVASVSGLTDRDLDIIRGTISGILANGAQGAGASPPSKQKAEGSQARKKRA
jgi:hypothetical protein